MLAILLLVTAFLAAAIYFRTDNDIFSLLALVTSLACLIWGLVVAHWLVQLLVLGVILFFSKPVAVTR